MSDPTPGPTMSGATPSPAPVSAFDDSQKRWATFLEYLKVDIGLAGALLGAFALVFSDPSKIPSGFAKWVLAGVTVATLLSLVFSMVSIIWINKLFIDRAEAIETKAGKSVFDHLDKEAGHISLITLLGFLFLALSGLFIVCFIFLRASLPVPSPSAVPSVTDELGKFRQEETVDIQRLQSALSAGIANIADRLNQLIAIQQKDHANVIGALNGVTGPLQARISDLERKQAELERELRQSRHAPNTPPKDLRRR
jgi:hypothetical protein